jgi:hypothetical protein
VEREQTPTERRAFLLHAARVYLAEARSRRKLHPAFARTLLLWAAKARRDAATIRCAPVQGDLFA